MNKKLISTVVAGLLLAVNPAWGFKVNFNGFTPDKDIHEHITKKALQDIRVYFPNGQSAKLNENIIDQISLLASYNDEHGLAYGELHFDDSRLEESAARIKQLISEARTSYLDGTETDEGYAQWRDYSKFVLDIAQAMHTTQDFFAHSTWVETNFHLNAFDQNNKLEPLLKKLPYPKFGIVENPFGSEFSSMVGVTVLNDNPSNNLNDNERGGCNYSGYNAAVMRLTSAYFDPRMSIKINNIGFSTSAWNNLLVTGHSWPEERCVHGGDMNTADANNNDIKIEGGDGINKDHEGRQYHQKAKQSAIEASRNLMLEFLRVSGATTEAGSVKACGTEEEGGIFTCETGTKPSISNIKLSHITSSTDRRNVWSFSVSNNLNTDAAIAMLAASFNGAECEVFKFTDGPALMCPSTYKGKGTLKIYQKANPTFVLHQVDDFSVNPVVTVDYYPASGLAGVVDICTFCKDLVSYGVIVSYDINWGDGEVVNFVMGMQNGKHKHTYTSEGTKTVVITFKDRFGNTFEQTGTIDVSKSVIAINGGTKQILDKPVEFSLTKFFSDAASVLWQFFTSLGEDIISFAKDLTDKATWTFDKVGDYKAVAKIRSSEGVLETVEQNFSVRGEKASIEKTFNNPNLEREYDVQNIGLDTSDGTLRLPLNVGEVDTTFPYIWIANSGAGTISKLATRDHYRKNPQTGEQELVKTGQELGRYYTGPGNGNPSRTTVDQEGNVWVGNRDNNTITKVGLFEFGNCIDRNGNGKIDTSTGKDDIKDWSGYFGDGQGAANAQDECVLQHVALQRNDVETPSDIRMIAIDKDNNVFAGGHYRRSVFKLNGRTGEIIAAANTNGSFYGGLVDKEGNLWAVSRNYQTGVQKVSNDLSASQIFYPGVTAYGIALDKYNKMWITELGTSRFSAFDVVSPVETVKIFNQTGHYSAQGVATDDNGDIFIAGSSRAIVGHYKQVFVNGLFSNVEFVANYPVSSGPIGIAIDGKGGVWSSDYDNNAVSRITLAPNPVNAKIETFKVGYHPYNYSDMTGRTVRNLTNRQGTWEAVFDGATPGFEWKKLVWSLKQALPEGTTVIASVKASDLKTGLGGEQYKTVQSNETITGIKGRFIKVKFQLTSANQTSTPEITGIDLQ